MRTPYTYLIGWSKLKKFYYGVRYAKGCHPSDLWVKYFTSSTTVKEYREKYGEPDIIQVELVFDTPQQAYQWEVMVIHELNAVRDDMWLNKQNHNVEFSCSGHTEQTKKQMSLTHLGSKHTDETKRKLSDSKKGNLNPQYGKSHARELNPMFGRTGELNHNYGKPLSIETKKKLAETYQSRPKYHCQYCERSFDISQYKQWHGEKCKLSGSETSIVAGTRGRKQSVDHISNRGVALTGRCVSAEERELRRKIATGKVRSEESKAKQSDSLKGKYVGEKHPMFGKYGDQNPNYGKKRSMEVRQKMSELAQQRSKLPCENCGNLFAPSNLAKHMNKCKSTRGIT